MASEKKFLSFDDIQNANDITVEEFEVPEWGGFVKVKSISKRQMNLIKKQAEDENGDYDDDLLEKTIFIEGLVEPKITEAQYELLLDKSASAMSRLSKKILGVSKLSSDDDNDVVVNAEKKFRNRRR